MSDKIHDPFSLDAWREYVTAALLKEEKQKIADELVSFIHKEHVQVCAERDWLRSEVEQLKKDAERYRWLRDQTWDSADLCVVVRPKDAVKLGHDCPSGDRLDTKIDAAMANK